MIVANPIRRALLILSLCLTATAAGISRDGEKTVTMGSTEFPPYYGAHLPGQGVLTEIAVRAMQRMGYRVEVQFTPFARTLANGKAGAVDGIIALWHSDEREQWFVFSEPLAPSVIGFYKRKSSPIRYKSLADLAPYRIGTVNGYADPPAFIAAQLHAEAASSDDVNMKKLAAGHLDLVLIDRAVARYIIDTEMPEHANELEWLGPPIELRPQYIAFSRNAPHYEEKLRDFNLGLKKLSESGELQALLKKGGLAY